MSELSQESRSGPRVSKASSCASRRSRSDTMRNAPAFVKSGRPIWSESGLPTVQNRSAFRPDNSQFYLCDVSSEMSFRGVIRRLFWPSRRISLCGSVGARQGYPSALRGLDPRLLLPRGQALIGATAQVAPFCVMGLSSKGTVILRENWHGLPATRRTAACADRFGR